MDKNKEVKGQNIKNEGAGKSTARVSSKKSKTAFSVSNFLAGNKTASKTADVKQTTASNKTEVSSAANKPLKDTAKTGGVVASIYNTKRKAAPQQAPAKPTPNIGGAQAMPPRPPYGAPTYPNGVMPAGQYYAGQPMPPRPPYGAPTYPNGVPYGYPYMPNGMVPPNPYYAGQQPYPYMPNGMVPPNAPAQSTQQPTQPVAPTKETKQPEIEEEYEEYEDEPEEEYDDEQTEQERLKEQTLNYFAERTWTRKPQKIEEETDENGDDLDFDQYLEDLENEPQDEPDDNEAESDASKDEELEDEQPQEPESEELEDEQPQEPEAEVPAPEEMAASEESVEERPLQENKAEETNSETEQDAEAENKEPEKEPKKEPKAISKLDYFKYRFVDNTAVGTQGKARVEELATRFGARREDEASAGFIASKDGENSKIEDINGFNKEEINLDFSKKGSVKVYKSSKGLSVASIFFAILYAIGALVAFMMLGTPTKETAKVVAMSINVADGYYKYAEVGETIDLSAYTLTLTNEDGTTTTIKANNNMVSSWPNCVDSTTYQVKGLESDAEIRLSYNDSFFKTIKLTTYQFVAESAYYVITDGTNSINANLSNILVYVNFIAKKEDNSSDIGGKVIKKQQIYTVHTGSPNTKGHLKEYGIDGYQVCIDSTSGYMAVQQLLAV